MKVLIVGSGKPTLKYPLNGNFEFEQAVALAAAGLDVVYFAVDLRSVRRKRPWGILRGKEKGVLWYVISLPIGAVSLSLLCSIGSIALQYNFRKVFRKPLEYPNVIHAHFTEMGCMSAVLSSRYHIPLIITEHSSLMNQQSIDSNLLKCAEKGYRQAKRVIAVSNALKMNIYKHTGINSVIIPNMIKLEVFNKSRRLKHSGFHLVSTGNLVPGKRFANLIKAFGKVINNGYDMYLHIIGDGYMKDELMTLAKDMGIDKRIVFHGYQNAESMTSIYELCDCFVLASASETFGVVYIEAMAAGLPVIATRCGGPEDFVNSQNGVLVKNEDNQQLCDAIEYMYHNVSNYISEDIRCFAEKNFSQEVIAQRIIDIYDGIVSSHN